MQVDLYARCWNDAEMLGFFFRHYDQFVNRYIIFDDGSTDNSVEILRAHPKVDIRPFPAYEDPDSRIISNHKLLEVCWKESKNIADWVIVTDIDEHIWHPNIIGYLKRMKQLGVTLIPALGFDMIQENMPNQDSLLSEVILYGAPSSMYSKANIFSPTHIDNIGFGLGRHISNPSGQIKIPHSDELLLLHYKYIGFNRVLERHKKFLKRQRKKDLENNWGIQYSWGEERLRMEFDSTFDRAINIKNANSWFWERSGEKKWWDNNLKSNRLLSD